MGRRARIVACCLSLSILCLTGCLIPYAYPNLTYVPSCDIGLAPDCHVFRVDVEIKQADIDDRGDYKVVEIPRGPDGRFAPQVGFDVDRGVYVFGVAANYNIGCLHSTRVRLYSPGFQLVELEPWDVIDKVQWKPAQNFGELEKAIDGLLLRPDAGKVSGNPVYVPTDHWQTGYISTATTDEFAAAEYERIAAFAPTSEDVTRLRKKAEELRTQHMLSPTYFRSKEQGPGGSQPPSQFPQPLANHPQNAVFNPSQAPQPFTNQPQNPVFNPLRASQPLANQP
jgi:hypothetical protein